MKHRIQDQRTLARRICVDLGPASPFEGSWMTPGSDCLRVEPQCQLPTFHQSPVVLRPVANLISEGVVAFAHPLAYQGGERWGWSQISATTPRAIADDEEVPVETKLWLEWRAKGILALALICLGRCGAAMDAFRSAYAAFVPYHELAIREMLRIVPELIAAGASEQDLVEVLSADDKKSRTLAPLIVALLQRRGDTVRVPAEVREVAEDISKSIQERIAEGVRPGFGRLIW